MNYTIQEISKIVEGKLSCSQNLLVQEIVTDTRTFFHAEKALFIALEGKKRDGHTFIDIAHKKGIRNFLVKSLPKQIFEDANYIFVDDVLVALQKLAIFHRQQYDLQTIGITGSHGKTIVKEWLYQLLNQELKIVKSPKSYNSQLGVPLSILAIDKNDSHGIFEAGISQPNEMQRLETIIQPNIGIITNITDAHLQNFASYSALVNEKIQLIKNCQKIIINGDNEEILSKIKQLNPNATIYSWGKNKNCLIQLIEINQNNLTTELVFQYNLFKYRIIIPFSNNASIENSCTVFSTLAAMELDLEKFLPKFSTLTPVEMRLEINQGINQCILINDGYNADLHSIKVALQVLIQQKQTNKSLILSSLNEADDTAENYEIIAYWVNNSPINKVILIGEEIAKYQSLFNATNCISYENTEIFLTHLFQENFSNEAILIKGTYSHNFGKISDALALRSHDTIIEINLHALINNLHQFKAKLQPNTKIMCMVKAFGYGTGGYEIAQALEYNGVDYLGVAYADEGAALRKQGISLPIMVMNPEQSSYDIVIKNQLEPEIYSFRVLEKFVTALDKYYLDKPYPIHIKLDTGMNRLGFKNAEISTLKELLNAYKNKLEVKSIFTHLAASEDKNEVDFTTNQFSLFSNSYDLLTADLLEKPIRHILNSAGIINYPAHQFDMVRLGIGLYGFVSNSDFPLEIVATFKTVISQIKTIENGETVGYNRKFKAIDKKRIAVLPVGYADGIHRILGNENGFVIIHNQKATIIGTICMDTMMVDVTNIPCSEGDEVCIFGKNPSIEEVAMKAQTIPYEILTSISQRVKRVYYRE